MGTLIPGDSVGVGCDRRSVLNAPRVIAVLLALVGVAQLLLLAALGWSIYAVRGQLDQMEAERIEDHVTVYRLAKSVDVGAELTAAHIVEETLPREYVVDSAIDLPADAVGRAVTRRLKRRDILRSEHFAPVPRSPWKVVGLDDAHSPTTWGGSHDVYGVLPGVGACLLVQRARGGDSPDTPDGVLLDPELAAEVETARANGWWVHAAMRSPFRDHDVEPADCVAMNWPELP